MEQWNRSLLKLRKLENVLIGGILNSLSIYRGIKLVHTKIIHKFDHWNFTYNGTSPTPLHWQSAVIVKNVLFRALTSVENMISYSYD